MIFINAIVVKIRDGQVTNQPIYVAIGVTVNGERDILGLWAGVVPTPLTPVHGSGVGAGVGEHAPGFGLPPVEG